MKGRDQSTLTAAQLMAMSKAGFRVMRTTDVDHKDAHLEELSRTVRIRDQEIRDLRTRLKKSTVALRRALRLMAELDRLFP